MPDGVVLICIVTCPDSMDCWLMTPHSLWEVGEEEGGLKDGET